MSTYFTDLSNALRADFDTRFTTAGVTKKWENEPVNDGPEEEPWVRYDLQIADVSPEILGQAADDGNIAVGQIVIQIFTPFGEGSGEAWTIANTISDLYKKTGVTIPKTSGGNYTNQAWFTMPAPRVIGTSELTPQLYQINVEAPFEHQT